jgi:hypothetical protein
MILAATKNYQEYFGELQVYVDAIYEFSGSLLVPLPKYFQI